MARLRPSRISDATRSAAERRLFRRIADELSDEWIVLHSVGLVSHPRKPWAEIDFVLIGPPGIYCLEVKGGRVDRHDGSWTFTDRFDRTTSKNEGPFEQAGSASAALRKYLCSQLRQLSATAFGYGVAMPDISFKIRGPDIEASVLYDVDDAELSFSRYVDRLTTYWADRLEGQRGKPRPLTEGDCLSVADLLRTDFELRPSLRARAGLVTEELLRLTEDQCRALEALSDNDRVLLQGTAGTGKTLLAVEEALRLRRTGLSVAYFCFNRLLADYVRQSIGNKGIEVHGLHQWMSRVVSDAGIDWKLPSVESADLFQVHYPEACLDVLLSDEAPRIDALIVDEAQDLLSLPYLDVFDALLSRGLDAGKWRFFYDPTQGIHRVDDQAAWQRLHESPHTRFRLDRNVRNTAQVATTTALLSGFDA